jgi:hypothetical protein
MDLGRGLGVAHSGGLLLLKGDDSSRTSSFCGTFPSWVLPYSNPQEEQRVPRGSRCTRTVPDREGEAQEHSGLRPPSPRLRALQGTTSKKE